MAKFFEGFEATKFNILDESVGLRIPNYQLSYSFGSSDILEVIVSDLMVDTGIIKLTIKEVRRENIGNNSLELPMNISIYPEYWEDFVKSRLKKNGVFRGGSGKQALDTFKEWYSFYLIERAKSLKEKLIKKEISIKMICM